MVGLNYGWKVSFVTWEIYAICGELMKLRLNVYCWDKQSHAKDPSDRSIKWKILPQAWPSRITKLFPGQSMGIDQELLTFSWNHCMQKLSITTFSLDGSLAFSSFMLCVINMLGFLIAISASPSEHSSFSPTLLCVCLQVPHSPLLLLEPSLKPCRPQPQKSHESMK